MCIILCCKWNEGNSQFITVRSEENYFSGIKCNEMNNSLDLARKYTLGYLSLHITSSENQTVSRERRSRKIVSFKDQIMSKGICLSIFPVQMEATGNSLHLYGKWQIAGISDCSLKCVLFLTIFNGQIFWFCWLLSTFRWWLYGPETGTRAARPVWPPFVAWYTKILSKYFFY